MSLSSLSHDEVPLFLRQETFSQVIERLPKAETPTETHSINALLLQTQLGACQSVCLGAIDSFLLNHFGGLSGILIMDLSLNLIVKWLHGQTEGLKALPTSTALLRSVEFGWVASLVFYKHCVLSSVPTLLGCQTLLSA